MGLKVGRKATLTPGDAENEDVCQFCGLGGELVCCDDCPNAFHFVCWYHRTQTPFRDYQRASIGRGRRGSLVLCPVPRSKSEKPCLCVNRIQNPFQEKMSTVFKSTLNFMLNRNGYEFALPDGYREPYSMEGLILLDCLSLQRGSRGSAAPRS